MRLKILAIGKMKKGPESDLLARYAERAEKSGRRLGISGPELLEWPESRDNRDLQRKEEEASCLLAAVKPGGMLIALDENGKDMTSREFSEVLRTAIDRSVPEICLAVGGPDGHGKALLDKADLVLRFGRMTWPHQLARVMLAEQLYRAMTILSGHPYHRT